MQVELSLDQLRAINEALDERYFEGIDIDSGHSVIKTALAEAEELESIDLNDCAGGACKL